MQNENVYQPHPLVPLMQGIHLPIMERGSGRFPEKSKIFLDAEGDRLLNDLFSMRSFRNREFVSSIPLLGVIYSFGLLPRGAFTIPLAHLRADSLPFHSPLGIVTPL